MHILWSTLALQLINFAILVWLLQHFLYRPVLRMVDARRAAIDGEYAAAVQAKQAADERLTELGEARRGIAAERDAALAAAAAEAERQAAARRAQAEQDAGVLIEETRKSLASERERLLEQARDAAFDLAADIAGRLLAQAPARLRAQAWLERILNHLEKLPQSDRAELMGELAGGAPLRIITAVPLAAANLESWRAALHRALAPGVEVTFEGDPKLIAGAELHFPHATLTFSLRSVLLSLRTELGAHGRNG